MVGGFDLYAVGVSARQAVLQRPVVRVTHDDAVRLRQPRADADVGASLHWLARRVADHRRGRDPSAAARVRPGGPTLARPELHTSPAFDGVTSVLVGTVRWRGVTVYAVLREFPRLGVARWFLYTDGRLTPPPAFAAFGALWRALHRDWRAHWLARARVDALPAPTRRVVATALRHPPEYGNIRTPRHPRIW